MQAEYFSLNKENYIILQMLLNQSPQFETISYQNTKY